MSTQAATEFATQEKNVRDAADEAEQVAKRLESALGWTKCHSGGGRRTKQERKATRALLARDVRQAKAEMQKLAARMRRLEVEVLQLPKD